MTYKPRFSLSELNDRLTDAVLDDHMESRSPDGLAGGDLSGSFPSPDVSAVNGLAVGVIPDGTFLQREGESILGAALTSFQWSSQIALTNTVNSTSGTFADALSGNTIVLPQDGTYLIIFEGNFSGNILLPPVFGEISISVNGSSVASTVRVPAFTGNNQLASFMTIYRYVGLSGATIGGMFRRVSGLGTVTVNNRTLTVILSA